MAEATLNTLSPLLHSLFTGQFQPRLYRGIQHGLNDLTRGLLGLFPHKRSVAYVKGSSPHLNAIMAGLAREGVFVQELSLLDLKTPQDLSDKLKKDTLFVLLGEDDPLTGALFGADELIQVLKEKKIFSLLISHTQFLASHSPKSVESHTAYLLSLDHERCIGVLGSRARSEPLLYGDLVWSHTDLVQTQKALARWQTYTKPDATSRERIQIFEAEPVSDSIPFFSRDSARIFDRSVLLWSDIDGSAIVELLKDRHTFNEDQALFAKCETSSGCRWESWGFGNWLLWQGVSIETQRGLVVFDHALLTDAFRKSLSDILLEVRTLQSGHS